MFVHLEHLLSIEVDTQKDGGYRWEEDDGAPGVGEGPKLELRNISSENHEAKKISDEDQRGMALEGWIRAGERNFSKAQQKEFDERDRTSRMDGGMQERGT